MVICNKYRRINHDKDTSADVWSFSSKNYTVSADIEVLDAIGSDENYILGNKYIITITPIPPNTESNETKTSSNKKKIEDALNNEIFEINDSSILFDEFIIKLKSCKTDSEIILNLNYSNRDKFNPKLGYIVKISEANFIS